MPYHRIQQRGGAPNPRFWLRARLCTKPPAEVSLENAPGSRVAVAASRPAPRVLICTTNASLLRHASANLLW